MGGTEIMDLSLKDVCPSLRMGTDCLICGEFVELAPVGPKYAICDKCKAAVLEVRRQMNCPVPKTCIIRFTDKDGSVSYLTESPKSITPKLIKEKFFRKAFKFGYRQDAAQLFTRSKADKVCRCFREFQHNGYFIQFVRADVLKDNDVIFFCNYQIVGDTVCKEGEE